MGVNVKSVTWTQNGSLNDLIASAQGKSAEYLVVESRPGSECNPMLIASQPSTDLMVFRDASSTQQWTRLNDSLPSSYYFLAVQPSDHLAVAITMKTLAANPKLVAESHSLNELVVQLSSAVTASFIDGVKNDSRSTFQPPSLTTANSQERDAWLRELIHQIPDGNNQLSSTAHTALKAGLFLINDFFDDSHSCSQSIEGRGSHHTGDYWHAILHRREPDYGNAKYWFRHVGQHPACSELAKTVLKRISELSDGLASKLQPWNARLVTNGRWDPFAFVDLCTAAEGDAELRNWCEQVQYDEMLLLLESSGRDVNNHERTKS